MSTQAPKPCLSGCFIVFPQGLFLNRCLSTLVDQMDWCPFRMTVVCGSLAMGSTVSKKATRWSAKDNYVLQCSDCWDNWKFCWSVCKERFLNTQKAATNLRHLPEFFRLQILKNNVWSFWRLNSMPLVQRQWDRQLMKVNLFIYL